jgi:hypothetical protein
VACHSLRRKQQEGETEIFPVMAEKSVHPGNRIMPEKKENKKTVTFLCHVFLVFST